MAGGNSDAYNSVMDSPGNNNNDNSAGDGEPKPWFKIENDTVRQCLAETLGTAVFVAFGVGSVAQTVLSQMIARKADDTEILLVQDLAGDWTTISIGFGLGLALGIYVAVGVSGGHLNPAVSFAMAIFTDFSWLKLPLYILSQMVGGYLGALIVYCVYFSAFDKVGDYTKNTAGIFASYPKDFETNAAGFVDQMIGTAFLVGGIFAITDPNNAKVPLSAVPALIGVLLTAIALAFGYNSGFTINPARDFGPRTFSACAGWGSDVYKYNDYWFWIPVIAPFVGSFIGAFFYKCLVGFHNAK